jgi:membrane protease YdiL (CAAX protease family)
MIFPIQSVSLYQQLVSPLHSPDSHIRTTARLILVLLILRIPWIWLMFFVGKIPILNGFGSAVFVTGTAAVTAYLIWHEKDHLHEFHLDRLAVLFFLIGHPLHLLLIALGWKTVPVATLPLYALFGIAPLWLIWKLHGHWRLVPRMNRSAIAWVAAGSVTGIILGGTARVLIWFQDGESFALLPSAVSGGDLLLNILYQAVFAALNEEPVFRGLLWGCLVRLNWPVRQILLFQAALFAFAHLDALIVGSWITPLIAFLLALVFGWLAWRSRTIASSTIAHGIINGLGTFMR